MLRALSELSRLSGIAELGKKIDSSSIKFNATLPVTIKIKEIIREKEFLLDIGNKKEIKTKSEIPLERGKKYWGVLKEHPKTKAIMISNLFKQPQILQQNSKKLQLPLMNMDDLEHIFSEQKPKEVMKFTLLTKLANSNSRHEFLSLSNMLQALNENVFSFILSQNSKEGVIQFRARREKKRANKKDKESDVKIDFYAAFENLGPIQGVIELVGEERRLTLYIQYENSLEFLKKELNNLDLQTFLYKKEGNIYPLFEYQSSLLDLKG